MEAIEFLATTAVQLMLVRRMRYKSQNTFTSRNVSCNVYCNKQEKEERMLHAIAISSALSHSACTPLRVARKLCRVKALLIPHRMHAIPHMQSRRKQILNYQLALP